MTQLTCPDNYGDIAGAVIFSGMIKNPYMKDPILRPVSLAEAEQNGVEFLEFLGVKTIDEAREIDPFVIREKYAQFRGTHMMMSTIIDGIIVKEEPYTAFTLGHRAQVPVISGNTADEFFGGIAAETLDEALLKARDVYGNDADDLLTLPGAATKRGPFYASANVVEVSVKGAFLKESNRQGGLPCYYYRFCPDIPGWDNPGTFHSVDLWFWFNTIDKCWRPVVGRHFDLARQMSGYWVNFIKTGDPNGKDSSELELPVWKPYSAAEKNEMEFTSQGAAPRLSETPMVDFLAERL